MDDILAKSIIEKVETQESKVGEMETAIRKLSGSAEEIELLKREVGAMKEIAKGVSFPIQEMRELSSSLRECRMQLTLPIQKSVQHHHHFPKVIWATIGLFLALATVCAGWYTTGTSLNEYKANDTKYRYLKVFGSNSLKEILFDTDSLYRAEAGLHDRVVEKEEESQRIFELLQEAKNKETEAEELRQKAKRPK